jgi:hypothetical protein
MSNAAALPNREIAELHLRLLAPGTERFTFQTFMDCAASKAKGVRDPLVRILHGSLAENWNELVQLSAAGAGIYVTVNETDFRGRSSDNVVRVRAHFGDLDGAPLRNLTRMPLRPHFVVQSSTERYHAYWRRDGGSLENFKPTQQRLAKLLDGDSKVCDLPRVMRLAGFPHQKDPARPFLVTICAVQGAPPSPYSDQEFQKALAAAESAQLKAPDACNVAKRPVSSLGDGPPDMQQGYPDGQRTGELTRRAGWCLGPWNMSEEQTLAACVEWNRQNTPLLSDKKIRSTVASIAKSEARRRQADPTRSREQTEGCSKAGQANNENQGASSSADDRFIDELASLSIIAYGRRRKDASAQLGIGLAALDKAVTRRRAELEDEAEERPLFPCWTVEPWPEPVDGDALILALVRRIQSHIILPNEAALTVALWIIFSWVHADAAVHSPILMVTAPEPDCGKSTLLGLIGFLVRRALQSVGISPAALYRSIEKWNPTIIIDEADVAFVQNEDLRAVVNSGWTRGTGIVRCEGDDHEPRLFPTFCPKAIGLKGKKLPDTTASRAIVAELKRKRDGENVADFRHVDDDGLQVLRRQILRWTNDNVATLANATPTLPLGFSNRLAANWHLLLAVAETAGGEWPEKAREAAARIAKVKASLNASIGVQLLSDIRAIFDNGTDRVFSFFLIEKLTADPEGPWATYNRGTSFTQKQLATRLGEYGIVSETVWIDRKSAKGYKRAAFEDAWTRYLSG